jgi:hypothetical protein
VSCWTPAALPLPFAAAAAPAAGVSVDCGDSVPADAAAPAGVMGACEDSRLGEAPPPSLLPSLLVVRRWLRASADVRGPFMARPDCPAVAGAAVCRGPLTAAGGSGAGGCSCGCCCCGAFSACTSAGLKERWQPTQRLCWVPGSRISGMLQSWQHSASIVWPRSRRAPSCAEGVSCLAGMRVCGACRPGMQVWGIAPACEIEWQHRAN